MNRFFVGQRVRMVATDDPAAQPCVGRETRIIDEGEHDLQGEYWDLANGWSVTKYDAGSFIEPILADGDRAGDCSLAELLDRCKHGEGVQA